jgi:GDSL-like Lipase/Acylhydrolase family
MAQRTATGFLAACLTATMLLAAVAAPHVAALVVKKPIVGMAATPDGGGYWEVASDGGIFAFGDAGFYGSMGGTPLDRPIVGLAATPDGAGYWEVASDGGIFAFGDAGFFGSEGGRHLNASIVGLAPAPDGAGYWLVASDGGIFAFGEAGFFGSEGGHPLDAPIVAIAATRDGGGYWEVASDGGIFAFGDAGFHGSMAGTPLDQSIVGVAATPDGGGYWEVASDGGIFAFGDAAFFGSTGGVPLSKPIVGMAAASGGYWEAAADGGIFNYGAARFEGSVPGLPPPGPPRVILYGDSLVSEAGTDFSSLANDYGASAEIRTYPGTATCDWLTTMAADAQAWQPTAVVLAFSGNNFSPCMAGDQLGTPQYYAKYESDTQSAISIFRAIGTKVVLAGLPLDASAVLSQNVTQLNQIYQSLASRNVGVTYDDAGQAVEAGGQFTWTLPCLPDEPCTGPDGTNVVRSPDGIHFCPDGHTTLVGALEECDVYSSGALRFAAAMLGSALSPPSFR